LRIKAEGTLNYILFKKDMKTEKEAIKFLLHLFSICCDFYMCDLNTEKEREEEKKENKEKKRRIKKLLLLLMSMANKFSGKEGDCEEYCLLGCDAI
jgi:CRISPR/Cas system-associated protein Cas7 (RAMP superfamily)